jgi:hypothetical protein
MSSQPTPIPADHPTHDAQANRDALNELRDIGMRFARTVDAQREAAAEDLETTAELTVTFDRVARAVRRTILLFQHLHDPAPAAQLRTAARTRILRDVEDAIHREAEGREAERLRAELHERLDAPDLDDDIGRRPVADITTDIRRDLGIAGLPGCNPYQRRTPADIAALNARAAKPRAAHLPLPPGQGWGEGLRREPHQAPGDGQAAPSDHPGAPERLFRIIAAPNRP